MRDLLPAALSIVLVAACATTAKVPQDVDGWLKHAAVPLENIESATAKFVEATREARVIGLASACVRCSACMTHVADWKARTDSAPWFRFTSCGVRPSKQSPSSGSATGAPRSLAPRYHA